MVAHWVAHWVAYLVKKQAVSMGAKTAEWKAAAMAQNLVDNWVAPTANSKVDW
jgi:hypothetical protein